MAGHHDHHDATPHDHEHEHGNEAATPSALAEHGHVHNGHGREHGVGGHNHGSGVLGWIRGTFAHSHNVADQIDASLESNELGIWALKWSLIEGATIEEIVAQLGTKLGPLEPALTVLGEDTAGDAVRDAYYLDTFADL